jgi:hypothetical protein
MAKQFFIPIDDELTLKILTPKHAAEIFALVDRNRAYRFPGLIII